MLNSKRIGFYKKVGCYGVIGVIGTAVHLSTLVFLVEVFRLSPIFSSAIGFILTVLISFGLNRKYTFQENTNNSTNLFIKYFLVSILGLLTNSFIMYFTIEIHNLHYIFGQIITIICIPTMNFLLNNYWTFRISDEI
ncbi:GtrA family protein [Bacillus sp. FJAT-29814]|uniref:GtrA family protein n=1 Tax=Bacillus sp. FJAT-29814 TaxID=1729688 RepID=UPI000830492D